MPTCQCPCSCNAEVEAEGEECESCLDGDCFDEDDEDEE